MSEDLRTIVRAWRFRCNLLITLCSTFLAMPLYLCIPQFYDRTPLTTAALFLSPFLASAIYFTQPSALHKLLTLGVSVVFTIEMLRLEERILYTTLSTDLLTIISGVTGFNVAWMEGTNLLLYAIYTVLFYALIRSVCVAPHVGYFTSPLYTSTFAFLKRAIGIVFVYLVGALVRWALIFIVAIWLLNSLFRNAPAAVRMDYTIFYYLVVPFVTLLRFIVVLHSGLRTQPVLQLEDPTTILPIAASLSVGFGMQSFDLMLRRVSERLYYEEQILELAGDKATAIQFGETKEERKRRLRAAEQDAKLTGTSRQTRKVDTLIREYQRPECYDGVAAHLTKEDLYCAHAFLVAVSRATYLTDWSSFNRTFTRAGALADEASRYAQMTLDSAIYYHVPRSYVQPLVPFHVFSYETIASESHLYLLDVLTYTLLSAAVRIGLSEPRFLGGQSLSRPSKKDFAATDHFISKIAGIQRKVYNMTAPEPLQDLHRQFTDHYVDQPDTMEAQARDVATLATFLDQADNPETAYMGILQDDAGFDFLKQADPQLANDNNWAINPVLNIGVKPTAQFDEFRQKDEPFLIRNRLFAFLMAFLVGRYSLDEIVQSPWIIESYTLKALLRRLWLSLFEGSALVGNANLTLFARCRYWLRNRRALRLRRACFDIDASIAMVACNALHDYMLLVENTGIFVPANEIIAETAQAVFQALLLYRAHTPVSASNSAQSRRLMAALQLLADRVVVVSPQ